MTEEEKTIRELMANANLLSVQLKNILEFADRAKQSVLYAEVADLIIRHGQDVFVNRKDFTLITDLIKQSVESQLTVRYEALQASVNQALELAQDAQADSVKTRGQVIGLEQVVNQATSTVSELGGYLAEMQKEHRADDRHQADKIDNNTQAVSNLNTKIADLVSQIKTILGHSQGAESPTLRERVLKNEQTLAERATIFMDSKRNADEIKQLRASLAVVEQYITISGNAQLLVGAMVTKTKNWRTKISVGFLARREQFMMILAQNLLVKLIISGLGVILGGTLFIELLGDTLSDLTTQIVNLLFGGR